MKPYHKELVLAKQLASEAGAIMRKYFRTHAADPTVKSDRTLVTKADIEINNLVIDILGEATPQFGIWGEEKSLPVEGASHTWVCDPVDGTTLFAKGLPLSSFSLALVDRSGQSVVGVIYDPFEDRLFEAVVGQGALLNGSPISVSDTASLDGAYLIEELWIIAAEKVSFDDPKDVLNKKGAKVLTLCSSVIAGAFVAKGEFDALLFGQSKPEDMAALAVIVTEAGGRVTNLFGDNQRYDQNILGAVVSNGRVHDELCAILKNIQYMSKYLA